MKRPEAWTLVRELEAALQGSQNGLKRVKKRARRFGFTIHDSPGTGRSIREFNVGFKLPFGAFEEFSFENGAGI